MTHKTYEMVIVAVTALPVGWRHVFRKDDRYWVEACPAVLLEEEREWRWTDDGEVCTPTGSTRTSLAVAVDGGLEPVIGGFHCMEGYVCTIGPGDPDPPGDDLTPPDAWA